MTDKTSEGDAEITADYVNSEVREAKSALLETPDYEHLAQFLLSLRHGHLVVDVTGTPGSGKQGLPVHRRGTPKPRGPRVRTIRSTSGQLVLPIFTSMQSLRETADPERQRETRGAVMPALDALRIIESDRFVAAEFDPATPGTQGANLVVLRKYITLVLGDDEITATTVESLK